MHDEISDTDKTRMLLSCETIEGLRLAGWVSNYCYGTL
jgi:hypothetical protein